MPAGSKPGERRGGRQLGTPNALPDLRAITLRALMKAGGVGYLVRQAQENPMGFLSLLGKVMPREVHAELSGELKLRAEVRRDLVEKVIVLMQAPAVSESTGQDAANPAIEATATPLPAITHNPDTMLKAQRQSERETLSRRMEHARRDSVGTVTGAVQRAAAMHTERGQSYQEEATARIDGVRSTPGQGIERGREIETRGEREREGRDGREGAHERPPSMRPPGASRGIPPGAT